MLLFEKMENAIHLSSGRNRDKEDGSEERLPQKLERGDLFAMVLSAILVIVPAVLICLLGLAGISYLLLLHG